LNITIKFKHSEKMKLLKYAEAVRDKGHWGSSSLLTPEENILYDIIEKKEIIELTLPFLKILINWVSDNTTLGSVLTMEDIGIINKLYEGINKLYAIIRNEYEVDIIILEKLVDHLNEISGEKDGIKFKSPQINYSDNKMQLQITELKNEVITLRKNNRELKNSIEAEKKKFRLSKLLNFINYKKMNIFQDDEYKPVNIDYSVHEKETNITNLKYHFKSLMDKFRKKKTTDSEVIEEQKLKTKDLDKSDGELTGIELLEKTKKKVKEMERRGLKF
jgi:hypothetical protein